MGDELVNFPALQTEWRRVLITGSREWPAHDQHKVLAPLTAQLLDHGHMTIIHGDCPDQSRGRSVDRLARLWAQRVIQTDMRSGLARLRHEAYPADWDEFGKSAGPIRNKYMVELGADICLAFPTPSSRGTISCMKLAHAAGIEVMNLGTLPEGMSFP